MNLRLAYIVLLFSSLAAWWLCDNYLTPWVEQVSGYNQIENRDLSILLGHWVFGQGTRVLACVLIWFAAARYGLMPGLRDSLAARPSWRIVLRAGLVASLFLLAVTFIIGLADGEFGFHPYFPKMAGDLVSNMYEEIVYRGLMFCALYGVAAGSTFPLEGKVSKPGLIVATIGSCTVFALGHDQYSVALRVIIGVFSVGFVYPWVKTRSLWAPWVTHMVVDIISDTFVDV